MKYVKCCKCGIFIYKDDDFDLIDGEIYCVDCSRKLEEDEDA